MSAAIPQNNHPEIPHLDPVLAPGHSYESVTEKISSRCSTRPDDLGLVCGFRNCIFPTGHDDGRHRLAGH